MNTILQQRIEEAAKIYAESEVNRMDDSKYSMNEKKRLKMFDGYDVEEALISFSKQILQNQWISVDEALPEEDGNYIVTKYKDEEHYITCFAKWYNNKFNTSIDITHWMEIPKLHNNLTNT